MNPSDNRIQRLAVERLRSSSPGMIQVLTQDVIRQHIDRIEPACVADLFALAEARLPSGLANDLSGWAARAAREILDIPDGDTRVAFLVEVGELPPAHIPGNMRRAIAALGSVSGADAAEMVRQLAERWEGVEPEPVKLPAAAAKPVQSATVSHGAAAASTRSTSTAAPRTRVAKTPASMVDPRRAEGIRADATATLAQYGERGLKESILVAGIRHRSMFKDLTDEEVKAELRKLERERKLKHTGERWLTR